MPSKANYLLMCPLFDLATCVNNCSKALRDMLNASPLNSLSLPSMCLALPLNQIGLYFWYTALFVT